MTTKTIVSSPAATPVSADIDVGAAELFLVIRKIPSR